ncbi:uncharacterized protein N7459_007381 [Penicillium hispanicum]|uniref:uncharacterized protein n=1 Tax=Penicillium hispanicum TaxID=1080232 RepID=UPI00254269C6|nr:uncharacterized protein N7459_007381 [Penicillium hispanicum]KAJ5578417.1 hypothetical protein N7459_007381 [Penicillium hispanicum]
MFNRLSRFNSALSGETKTSSAPGKEQPLQTDQTTLRRQELQEKIFNSWKEVFLGLYQVHGRSSRGPQHYTRLYELFLGAGMSTYVLQDEERANRAGKEERFYKRTGGSGNPLGLLGLALQREGARKLGLYDNLPLNMLESVIEILDAYKKEAGKLNELYDLLRSLQVGFRAPTEEDENAVLQQFFPLADQLGRRLLHLDAKLDLLQSEMDDLVWEEDSFVTSLIKKWLSRKG